LAVQTKVSFLRVRFTCYWRIFVLPRSRVHDFPLQSLKSFVTLKEKQRYAKRAKVHIFLCRQLQLSFFSGTQSATNYILVYFCYILNWIHLRHSFVSIRGAVLQDSGTSLNTTTCISSTLDTGPVLNKLNVPLTIAEDSDADY